MLRTDHPLGSLTAQLMLRCCCHLVLFWVMHRISRAALSSSCSLAMDKCHQRCFLWSSGACVCNWKRCMRHPWSLSLTLSLLRESASTIFSCLAARHRFHVSGDLSSCHRRSHLRVAHWHNHCPIVGLYSVKQLLNFIHAFSTDNMKSPSSLSHLSCRNCISFTCQLLQPAWMSTSLYHAYCVSDKLL